MKCQNDYSENVFFSKLSKSCVDFENVLFYRTNVMLYIRPEGDCLEVFDFLYHLVVS